MKILNFGSINIDYVYSVPHIVSPGETISSSRLESFPGGKGANQSVALSKAGLEVFHAGKIGTDGEWILEKLQEYGVVTELVRIGKEPSGQAIIQVTDNGDNSIILYKGCNHLIDEKYIDHVLSFFNKGDILILQNEINNLDKIINSASDKELYICFNPAPYTSEINDLMLQKINFFVLNEIEGSCLTGGESDPVEILNKLSVKFPDAEIVLTLGEKGVLACHRNTQYKVEITPLKAVDTTGAGDTFIGYYIYGRSKMMNIQKSLELACRASSITVTRKGAMDSIPYVNELDL